MWRIGVVGLMSALFAADPALAQTGRITGSVTSAEGGAPVPGAQVHVQGTSVGAVTRDDGRYTITVQPGTYALRVTRIGFTPDSMANVVVRADEATTADFRLTPSAIRLAEVVAVGYGTQRATQVTGSVQTVGREEFNTGRIVNPEQLIQAKVPGVQVISNNEPGGGTTIRVRGGTSVNASNDPLYVVDGVPIVVGGGISSGRNAMNFINPNDIESITVLKDASATAIYGSRGANGVVLITTKSGAQGTQVTYDVSASNSRVVREPDLLSPSEFRAAVQKYAPSNVTLIGSANTDWLGAIERDATGQEHNLAFSGGRDAMRYRLSLGYLDQEGVIRGTNADRLSAALNYNDRMFGDKLEVRTNLKGTRTKDRFSPNGIIGAAIALAPTQPIRTSTGDWFQWTNSLGANNPVSDLALVSDKGLEYRSVGNIEAKYNAPWVQGLSATVRTGYDYARAERTTFSPSTAQAQAEQNLGGTFTQNNPSQLNTLLETFANYVRPLDALHGAIDLTAGYTYEQFQYDSTRAFAQGLSTDLLGPSGIPAAKTQQNFLDEQDSRLVSFFGRMNYTLYDRYILSASLRRDGSSKFGPGNQWGYFPSAGIAWRASDESFLHGIDWLSNLKLRLSWGVNGNQAFGNYLAYTSYLVGTSTAQVQFGDQFVSIIRPSAVDPNIKWEKTTSTDFGIDYGVFNDRITGSLEYYNKKTKDLIFNVPVAAGTNLSNYVTTNIGTLRNQGVEFGLNARVFDGKDGGFTWDASFNAAHNTNELLALYASGTGNTQILVGGISGAVGNNIQVLEPGQPINSFFVYKHKMQGGKPLYADVAGINAATGKIVNTPDGKITDEDLYVDLNGDGAIDQKDRRAYKSPTPRWTLGQSSNMTWRGFDASYTVRAHLGNYVYNNVASNQGYYNALTGNIPNNLSTSVLKTNFVTPQYFSDYYVEDASFLRMDNVTLGYTFRRLRAARQVRLYGTVQNVFTLTDYTGVDPEAAIVGFNTTFGIDNNIYPRARTFLAGASFTF